MATISITLDHACTPLPGNQASHFLLGISIDGNPVRLFDFHADEMMAQVEQEEVRTLLRLLLRAHARGKTRVQMRQDLNAGITVTTART